MSETGFLVLVAMTIGAFILLAIVALGMSAPEVCEVLTP